MDPRGDLVAVLTNAASGLDGAVDITRREHGWTLQPTEPRASRLTIVGDGPDLWRLTLGFGRSSARIDLRYMDSPTPRLALEEANQIIHSVMAGRLSERRKGQGSCRWTLTMSTGKVLRGASRWPVPWAMPWEHVDEEHFAPWT